ncbi:MAG: hypothetical protein M0031_04360 [Thermaerobacter sp.]|nr:hypothetical protein [Thermaerobacter sp.]
MIRILLFAPADPACPVPEELAALAARVLPFPVTLRPFPLADDPSAARGLAGARVLDPGRPWAPREPLPGEVAYEEAHLNRGRSASLLYDAVAVADIHRDRLSPPDRRLGLLPVFLTDMLIGTFDEAERRFHARAALFGAAVLLSLRGPSEALAGPREYHLLRRQLAAWGFDSWPDGAIPEDLRSRLIRPDDPRVPLFSVRYLLQAVFYRLTGDPFCAEHNCALYNAHHQSDLLAHPSPRLCPRHRAVLDGWRP